MSEMKPVIQQESAIQEHNSFQSLGLRAMFWRPIYLEQSAWFEHIPFAFWLVEAHKPKVIVELGSHHGTSYFAFCQAVERLGLDTRCFAVDTWKGDEHAGFYDENIFNKVRAFNEANYSGFSRLVRSTFDEALNHFSDGTVDLLHIDGYHTLEAVEHDFISWLPKLSDHAIVIFHDTNVRERNFGVYKLFERLENKYPSFEFVHGHGLGVLGIGAQQNNLLQQLFQVGKDESRRRAIQEVFARLGRGCADTFLANQQKERAQKLSSEVNKQKKEIEEFRVSLEKTKTDLATRSRDLTETRAKLQTHIEQHATERGRLAERADLLLNLRDEVRQESTQLQATIGVLTKQLEQRTESFASLESLAKRNEEQRDELRQTVVTQEKTIAELSGQQTLAESVRLELARNIDEQERMLTSATLAQQQIERQLTFAQERLAHTEATHAQLLVAHEDLQQTFITTAATNAQREAQVLGLSQMSRDKDAEIAGLRAEMSQRVQQHTAVIKELEQVLAATTAVCAERDQQLTNLLQISSDKDAEISRLRLLEQVLANTTALCSEREQQLADALQISSDKDAEISRLRSMEQIVASTTAICAERDQQIVNLSQMITEKDSEISRLRSQIDAVSAKLAVQEHAKAAAEQRATVAEELCRSASDNVSQGMPAQLVTQDVTISALHAELCTVKEQYALQIQQKNSEINRLKDGAIASAASLDQLRAQARQTDDTAHATKAELDAFKLRLSKSEADSRRLDKEKTELAASVSKRFSEIAKLTGMLNEAKSLVSQAEANRVENEHQLAKKDAHLQTLVQRLAKNAAIRFENAHRESRKAMFRRGRVNKAVWTLQDQMELITSSGLFDEEWYLERYPDVQSARSPAAEHYLRFGATEGRDPGPLFDTRAYLAAHADVSTAQMNPLVHYIRHGSKEGREINTVKDAQ